MENKQFHIKIKCIIIIIIYKVFINLIENITIDSIIKIIL